MNSTNNKLLLLYCNLNEIPDEIKANLNDNGFDSDRIVSKQFNSTEMNCHLIPNEELIQFEYIVIIGAEMASLIDINQRLRTIEPNLKLMIANMSQTFVYIFTDLGANFNHLSFGEYLQTFGDNISDKFKEKSDRTTHFKPLGSIISGFISGQIINRSRESPQLFSYEISLEIVSYNFDANRPVIVVGCGSLGFQIVKNLLAIGAKNIVLIDFDIVHKYNLKSNSFNECDVGLRKCDVVKKYAINCIPDINVETYYARAQQASSQFFESISQNKGVIVTAVDNIETKRFINKVSLIHSLPFIDVGVDCFMFHIQPIVPHLTESYFAYSDVSDAEYPLCVLKSFPQIIEHCVEWSKMKCENWFNKKPKIVNDWTDCLKSARLLFEKCFNHKAKQLLYSLPPDHINEDGSNFWADKKMPNFIDFNIKNQLHLTFIKSCAQLLAIVNNILLPISEDQSKDINDVMNSTSITEFIPKRNKTIIIDPELTAPNENAEHEESSQLSDDLKRQTYSKEDDIQLKFIYASANLRASMYGIETVTISEIRRISHKIIYCFGSSISTAAAIASIETTKLVELNGKYCIENRFENKNYFYNLSNFDLCVIADPGKPTKTKLSSSCDFTEWDYWLINENDNMTTLEDVLNDLKVRSGSVCTMMVMDDTKSVYLPELFPHHIKRKKQSMRDLIANYYTNIPKFVTLTVSFENEVDDIPGPNVKYILSDSS